MSRLSDVLDPVLVALDTARRGGKIVLLHPSSSYRSVVIATLLQSSPYPVFYYALGPDDTTLRLLLTNLTRVLSLQNPEFGRRAMLALADHAGDYPAQAAEVAADLAELSAEPYVLVLDEYDRSDNSDDIQLFLEELANVLPENCTLLLTSRTLPRLPWIALQASDRAIILNDDRLVDRDFYGAFGDTGEEIDVYALGPGFVLQSDEPIDSWEGHLPRLLLFFALERPVITRSEICEAFWPDLDLDQAVNVFHVTKRRLHKALGMDILIHHDGQYRVNPELNLRLDAAEFSTLLIRARRAEREQQKSMYQAAVEYYRGPYLQGHSDNWILRRRRDYRDGLVEALTEMARLRLEDSQPEQALLLLDRALHEDATREPVHRDIMRLYAQLGRRSEGVSHYRRLERDLATAGSQPQPETTAVYASLLS